MSNNFEPEYTEEDIRQMEDTAAATNFSSVTFSTYYVKSRMRIAEQSKHLYI